MGEVELVEGGLSGEARELEAALDSAPVAGFQFQVGQTFQGGGEAKILVAASLVIVSSFSAMVVRRSWLSFSGRVIGRLLSGFQDEGIVVEQGQRVGGELIEFRVAQLQGGLKRARGVDLV